jgi:hypothetical protein
MFDGKTLGAAMMFQNRMTQVQNRLRKEIDELGADVVIRRVLQAESLADMLGLIDELATPASLGGAGPFEGLAFTAWRETFSDGDEASSENKLAFWQTIARTILRNRLTAPETRVKDFNKPVPVVSGHLLADRRTWLAPKPCRFARSRDDPQQS